MDGIENEIRKHLVNKLKTTNYTDLTERANQLIAIHRSWIAFAQFNSTAEDMAEVLYTYQKNLNKNL